MGDDASNLYHVFQCATGRLGKPPTQEERKVCVELCTEGPWRELGKVVTATVRQAGKPVYSIRYCENAMREKIHELRKVANPNPDVAALIAGIGTASSSDRVAVGEERKPGDGWTPEQIAAAQRIATRNRGEDA